MESLRSYGPEYHLVNADRTTEEITEYFTDKYGWEELEIIETDGGKLVREAQDDD